MKASTIPCKRATTSICFLLLAQQANSQNLDRTEQESTVVLTPATSPTGTNEPTDYDTTDSETEYSAAISCKGFVLNDGTPTTIDSETSCERACTDRNSYQYYWPSWDHDYFQYTDFNMREDDFSDKRWIIAFGQCSCDYSSSQAQPQILCGPTEYWLPVPQEPLPQCSDIGIEYTSACSRKCTELYPNNQYYRSYDWSLDWSFSQGRYRKSCSCILNDSISVELCDGYGPKSNPNGSYNYSDEGNSIFPYLVILAILGVGGCICAVKKSPNEQDQALSQYRQQQQRRQETGVNAAGVGPSNANTELPTEEDVAARGDVVRSNLFSYTLSEDDDIKNLASIISTSGNGATNREDGGNEPSLPPPSGDDVGFLGTLRSALSTNRSSVRSSNKAECSICLMEYGAGESISWAKEEACDHVYHQECIVGWLSTAKRDGTLHDSCPLCRTKLVTETNVDEA